MAKVRKPRRTPVQRLRGEQSAARFNVDLLKEINKATRAGPNPDFPLSASNNLFVETFVDLKQNILPKLRKQEAKLGGRSIAASLEAAVSKHAMARGRAVKIHNNKEKKLAAKRARDEKLH